MVSLFLVMQSPLLTNGARKSLFGDYERCQVCTWVGIKTDSACAHKFLSLRGELSAQKLFAGLMTSTSITGLFLFILPRLILAVASRGLTIISILLKGHEAQVSKVTFLGSCRQ